MGGGGWPSMDDGRQPPQSPWHSQCTLSITRRSGNTHCLGWGGEWTGGGGGQQERDRETTRRRSWSLVTAGAALWILGIEQGHPGRVHGPLALGQRLLPGPGQLVIGAPHGKPVVPHADNALLAVHDARPDLRRAGPEGHGGRPSSTRVRAPRESLQHPSLGRRTLQCRAFAGHFTTKCRLAAPRRIPPPPL